MNLVIDAGVAIKWFLPEPFTQEALTLLDGRHDLVAPDFLLVECANILWKKVRLAEMERGDADTVLTSLRSAPVDLVATGPLIEPALALAHHEVAHPVYDCLYLATAQTFGAAVVTADRRFFERSQDAGLAEHIAWIAG